MAALRHPHPKRLRHQHPRATAPRRQHTKATASSRARSPSAWLSSPAWT
jgi:hypothetical protein